MAQGDETTDTDLPRLMRVPQHVVYRHFVNETVLLNLETGRYYGFNRTAGRMLEILAEVHYRDEAVARIASEYHQPRATIGADFDEFCRDLLNRGLLEPGVADDVGS